MTRPHHPGKFRELLDRVQNRPRPKSETRPPPSPPYSPVGHTYLPIRMSHRYGQMPFRGPFTADSRVQWDENSKKTADSPPLSPKSCSSRPFKGQISERPLHRSLTYHGERQPVDSAILGPNVSLSGHMNQQQQQQQQPTYEGLGLMNGSKFPRPPGPSRAKTTGRLQDGGRMQGDQPRLKPQ